MTRMTQIFQSPTRLEKRPSKRAQNRKDTPMLTLGGTVAIAHADAEFFLSLGAISRAGRFTPRRRFGACSGHTGRRRLRARRRRAFLRPRRDVGRRRALRPPVRGARHERRPRRRGRGRRGVPRGRPGSRPRAPRAVRNLVARRGRSPRRVRVRRRVRRRDAVLQARDDPARGPGRGERGGREPRDVRPRLRRHALRRHGVGPAAPPSSPRRAAAPRRDPAARRPVSTFLEGEAGCLALTAAIAHALGDRAEVRRAVAALLAMRVDVIRARGGVRTHVRPSRLPPRAALREDALPFERKRRRTSARPARGVPRDRRADRRRGRRRRAARRRRVFDFDFDSDFYFDFDFDFDVDVDFDSNPGALARVAREAVPRVRARRGRDPPHARAVRARARVGREGRVLGRVLGRRRRRDARRRRNVSSLALLARAGRRLGPLRVALRRRQPPLEPLELEREQARAVVPRRAGSAPPPRPLRRARGPLGAAGANARGGASVRGGGDVAPRLTPQKRPGAVPRRGRVRVRAVVRVRRDRGPEVPREGAEVREVDGDVRRSVVDDVRGRAGVAVRGTRRRRVFRRRRSSTRNTRGSRGARCERGAKRRRRTRASVMTRECDDARVR